MTGLTILGQDSTVDDLTSAVTEALLVLRVSRSYEHPLPLPDDAVDWIREVYTDRQGHLRMRVKLPKGTSRYGRALAGMLRWHQSGGNLDGLMIARAQAGDQVEEIDSLACLIIVLGRADTPALDAWSRTGLFG